MMVLYIFDPSGTLTLDSTQSIDMRVISLVVNIGMKVCAFVKSCLYLVYIPYQSSDRSALYRLVTKDIRNGTPDLLLSVREQ